MRTKWIVGGLAIVWISGLAAYAQPPGDDPRVADLAKEVRNKGWLLFGARGENGSWDLFRSRPDGSDRLNLTNTPDFEEAAPRVSPDGTRLLYRRFAKGTVINHDRWGFQGCLMIAHVDGTKPVARGAEDEFPWASWSADGKQVACLTKKAIQMVNLASKAVVRELPRQGIYQQLFWSPDGNWFCGTANHAGEQWTVVRVNATTGALNAVRAYQNCTPDWFPDSKRIIFSSRPKDQPGNNGQGFTQLWMADGDGSNGQLVYGEDGAHIYGGAVSPDGQYVLFTKTPEDGSGSAQSGGTLHVMRLTDAPTIGGPSPDLRKVHPGTKDGPVLNLDLAWEPTWTNSDLVDLKSQISNLTSQISAGGHP